MCNFVNLMDLAALAVPGPPRSDGLPFGVMLLAPAFHDRRLLELGLEWTGDDELPVRRSDTVTLAVAGAHMSGLPLSSEPKTRGSSSGARRSRGARLPAVRAARRRRATRARG